MEARLIGMSQELKALYLARRNPALDHDAFVRRWRRHGQLAMSLRMWRHTSGYAHADADAEQPAAYDHQLPGGWSDDVDGVGSIFLPSAEAFERFHSHPDYPLLRADEHATFDGLVGPSAVLLTETPIIQRPGTAAKAFAFLFAAAGISPDGFAQRWARHIGLVMRHAELTELLTGYVHGHRLGGKDDATGTVPGLGLGGVAGVAELGFAGAADRATYLAHAARTGIADDLADFCDLERVLLVATNEVTLAARRYPDA